MSHGQHKDVSLKKDHSPTRNKTKEKNIRVTGRLEEKELEEKGKKERKEGSWEGERERMKERDGEREGESGRNQLSWKCTERKKKP